ncbi:DUF1775 domain-containing protein [Hyphomicrobium sp. LHD-15]|uniref:DUF1775 domain-containing protein n=1 Tax=Hyphomicrobium sp. LHD-15 TaxID=3072142 RepID=UPI00280F1ECC|nr:DUF1775 domain-containing protein [Hyphomicrobium sp. LHD-15]MDQ8697433.1 DUF1775 domain-containing protein [Hyphomicrobium sp. LHD-15]
MTLSNVLKTASAAFMPLVFIASAAPAFAHVSLERGEAQGGASYKAVLKIPHGCDGSPTQTVRVEIPEGFIGVKPMPKPGWKLETVRGPYAKSYAFYHGKSLTEGVKQITWSGGELADEHYDEFVASGFLAKELEPGASLYFKVTQVCPKGELRWVEVPAEGQNPHDLEAPAALLKIASDETGAAPGTASITVGTLSIEGGWTRATPHGAKVAAGYLTIRNTGSEADTLVSVETPIAARGEIHDMTMTDGVMRMRRLADGIEIPAGGSVALKPGGMHLMFIDLKQPSVEGGKVAVKLTFKSGATAELELPIRKLGAAGDSSGGHQH